MSKSASPSADADPRDAQQKQDQKQHQNQKQQRTHSLACPAQSTQHRETVDVAGPPGRGRGGAVVSRMQQGLFDGTMSMFQVLSQESAVRAAELDKRKRSNTSSTAAGTPARGLHSSMD